MHIARLSIILFLIVAIMFTAGPLVRGGANQAWEHTRPDVLLLMDSLYAAIRNVVAGTGSHDGVNDDAPGANFEIIITQEAGILL